MYKIQSTLKAITAAGVLGALALTCAAQTPAPAAKKKQVKDQGEFEIYNQAIKDANNPAQQLKDLDTWTQKYPESDFKDDRAYLYMQAYSKTQPPQPLKVIEYGKQLIDKDLKTVFPDPASQPNILTVLFQVAWNVATLPNPTQEQLAFGEKAGEQLQAFIPTYFVPANKPANLDDKGWTDARADIEKRTKLALTTIRLAPANQALAKNDCATAESLYMKAMQENPDNASLSYNLGRALSCLSKANPDKSQEYASRAIYQFVRAAAIDPTLGGTVDAKKITDYANGVYKQYHGSEEGLDQLRQQAKASAAAPAGFLIESESAAAARKEKEFATQHPQIALWMGIKRQLTDPTNGQQYFEGQLKDADVSGQGEKKALKGVLLEGRPACRSKELLVAVAEPGKAPGPAEITLKLDTPLTGKPAAGEIEFDGVPRTFAREPFMLTMETEKAKISGLKLETCAAAPAARPASKKSATKGGSKGKKK
jgi:hypothetical protein